MTRQLAWALVACVLLYLQIPAAHAQSSSVYISEVPWFLSASHNGRQGFVRLYNWSEQTARVTVVGFDERGVASDEVTLEIDSFAAKHFNSDDFEFGNANKGLSGSAGSGTGDWRLEISSNVEDLEVYSYIRTLDNFLTAMGLTAERYQESQAPGKWLFDVPFFNPARNTNQRSRIRLTNHADERVPVELRAFDDADKEGICTVRIAAGATVTIDAMQLESGDVCSEGRGLGQGTGKWYLIGLYDDGHRITALSYADVPTGHLTNLSEKEVAMHQGEPTPVERNRICRAGDVIQPGASCRIYNTSIEFEVRSNGQGCLAGFICAGSGHSNRNSTINGESITFVASRNDDDSWTIEEVDPSPP